MSPDSVTVGETAKKFKIVLIGPPSAGKKTILNIFHSILKRENLFLADNSTQQANNANHIIFSLADKGTSGQHDFKIHLFTDLGQDRFKLLKKTVSQGLKGLIVVIDSSKAHWKANKIFLSEIFQIIREQITSGQVSIQIMLNKMDLPQDQRISTFETAKLLVEAGIKKNIGDAQVSILDVSALQAVKDLAELIKEEKFDPKDRPPSIQRIFQSIQMTVREILIKELRKRQNTSNSYSDKNLVPTLSIKQLALIEKLGAPDYETALKIQQGNFSDYELYQRATKFGAKNIQDYELTISLGAPDYSTAQKVVSGNFKDHAEYLIALSKKASTKSQLMLVLESHAPDYKTALKIKKAGFEFFNDFETAKNEGFSTYEKWEFKKTTKKALINFITRGDTIQLEIFLQLINLNSLELFNIITNFPHNLISLSGDKLIFTKFHIDSVLHNQINMLLCDQLSIADKTSILFCNGCDIKYEDIYADFLQMCPNCRKLYSKK